ncbi:MAG: radical SAM family heme chaperone HemW [Burkholderiales bacterium]|jgi:putative oxygen-independent coproporphyrinogen III oxidase
MPSPPESAPQQRVEIVRRSRPQAGADSSVGLTSSPPLAVYVHLPWCVRKCPYCDFNSHAQPERLPEEDYLAALRLDLEMSLPLVWGRTVHSVFIGGGTPSLFKPESIDRLLADLRACLRLSADAEITLEANPGTFERMRFRAYRDAGINRLSLGIQSFNDRALQVLGRVHDRQQALAAAQAAREDFPTFNLDLMVALPGQDPNALRADLAQAMVFEPPHLSVYQLTLEPNTLFAARPPEGMPDDDTAAELHEAALADIARTDLVRYEISAFARPGHRARHNLNYWQFGDYLGLGAGAHGKLSFHDRIIRQARWRHPETYIAQSLKGAAVEIERPLTASDLPFEFMLNALRLVEGVPASWFEERTGLPLTRISATLERLQERGLLDDHPGRIRATPQGLAFLNDLQSAFL